MRKANSCTYAHRPAIGAERFQRQAARPKPFPYVVYEQCTCSGGCPYMQGAAVAVAVTLPDAGCVALKICPRLLGTIGPVHGRLCTWCQGRHLRCMLPMRASRRPGSSMAFGLVAEPTGHEPGAPPTFVVRPNGRCVNCRLRMGAADVISHSGRRRNGCSFPPSKCAKPTDLSGPHGFRQ